MNRVPAAAYRFAHDHGPVALIAVASIAFMAWLWMTTVSSIANTLRDHSRDSGFCRRHRKAWNSSILGTFQGSDQADG